MTTSLWDRQASCLGTCDWQVKPPCLGLTLSPTAEWTLPVPTGPDAMGLTDGTSRLEAD